MKETLIVVGASGLVGSALLREFSPEYRVVGTFCSHPSPGLIHMDIRNEHEVRSVLSELRPGIVLCPAADPNVEFCEIDPGATRAINVQGVQNLVDAAARIEARFVYFSSEYVFDGENGPYSEVDTCNPLNEYGRQKLECERLIAGKLDKFVVARISGVFDMEANRKNFVLRLIDQVKAGKPFKVPVDQVITPTYAYNLASVVRLLLAEGQYGLVHVAGCQPLVRFEFARMIAESFDLDPSLILPVRTSEMGLRAARPRSAGLKIDRIKNILGFATSSPREGLEEMKRRMQRFSSTR